MPLYDAYGRPVKTGPLTKELAAPSLSSVRSVWQASVANGLTPQRVAQIVRAMEGNDPLPYLTLAEEMEERDLHYASVLRTRKLAVTGLQITVEAPTDANADKKITDFVSEVLAGDSVRALLSDLLDALGKGFSVAEIMWSRTSAQWIPERFEWRDPRFFQFDREQGREVRLRGNDAPADGHPLDPYKFVVHFPKLKSGIPVRGGLARLAMIMYVIKSYTVKDWLSFVEVFGMPIRIGKFADGASEEQKAVLLNAVANIGTDAAAIIPNTMVIDFEESNAGKDVPFEGLAAWCDEQVSKAVLGQTATTQGTPGRLGSDDAQHEVREDIRDDDALKLAETLNRDLVRPLVDLNFGPLEGRLYPRVCLREEEAEDLKLLSEALVPFVDRGMRVEASVIRDKFGLPEPEAGAEVLTAKAPAPAPGAAGEEDEDMPMPPMPRKPPMDMAEKARRKVKEIAEARDDEIDELAASFVEEWRATLGPTFERLIQMARGVHSYDELRARLKEITDSLPVDQFVERVATATFEARGLGDATDKVRDV